MLKPLYSKEGKQIGDIELRDDIFAVEPNEHAMHQAVVVYLAHQRQGTAKTKTRSEVSGGGKKPWRQKGRGTARSGSSRSPVWVGGGTVHGPQPHTYDLKLPKGVRRLAKKSALSLRCSEENLTIIEDFNFDEIKTKSMFQVLKNFDLEYEKILVLLPEVNNTLFLSSRNIPGLTIQPVDKISAYDILIHKKILMLKGAVEKLESIIN